MELTALHANVRLSLLLAQEAAEAVTKPLEGPPAGDPVRSLDNEFDQKEVALFKCAPQDQGSTPLTPAARALITACRPKSGFDWKGARLAIVVLLRVCAQAPHYEGTRLSRALVSVWNFVTDQSL